jgi:SAM-dependent methyltransferase
MLELGPGDSIFGGMAAWALGGQRVILVDAGAHAPIEVASCQAMATYLASQGLPAPMIPASADALEVLGACGIEYLTAGLQSLRDLPSASVDFVFSQAVLEHIRRAEFAPTMRELRRVLRPEGRCSHVVDLEDHLAGGLNNLRFRPDLWESPWMANSGFYTNRLRHCEVVRILSECGFTVQSIELQHWPALPIDRGALHEAFRAFDDDELRIRGFCVVLAPA